MNFDESLSYLFNLGNEVSAMKLGLENIKILLDALGNPEKKYLKIQIAGTNGKGSTCAFLEAICISAGISVGLTTSPHLISITERIKINGKKISEEDFAKHSSLIREISEALVEEKKLETVPTFFEQVTAMALNVFMEEKVELAILETGLGGRLDAATAAEAEIAVITPIDLDHQQILGDTIQKIAAEKAAIIREDTKVVISQQKPEAMKIILDRCANFGIAPKLAYFAAKIRDNRDGKLLVDFQTEKAGYQNVLLNLRGKHQVENAKTAILSAEILQNYLPVTRENIVEGLQTSEHEGRIEFYKNILFDGAHNAAGAKALREYLDEFISRPLTVIFGAMRDKGLEEIGQILFPKAENLIFTTPENSRSVKAGELAKFLPQNFNKKVHITGNVEEALQTAGKVNPGNGLICITGSLYLVGEAKKILKNQSG